jgi:hypothetical protein
LASTESALARSAVLSAAGLRLAFVMRFTKITCGG